MLIAQIGNQALFMLGAKDLTRSRDSLSFRVGRNSKGVNVIKITLAPDDTYSIEAVSIRKLKLTIKGELEGVYADALRGALETLTGMRTRLF